MPTNPRLCQWLGLRRSLLRPVERGHRQLIRKRKAGRVLAQVGDESTVVTAGARYLVVEPASSTGAPLQVGDLVLFHTTDGETERVLHEPAPEPTGHGEVGRILFDGLGERLLARDRARRAVRAYFEREDFIEVETPALAPCPGLDAHVHSLGQVFPSGSSDEAPSFLITSPELAMKRLLVGGLERIYQFAHCFRAEELGALHEPEFILLEWYRAFAGVEEVLTDTEQIVRTVAAAVHPQGRLSREVEGRRIELSLDEPFLRLTVAEAFHTFAQVEDVVDLAATEPDRYFDLLANRVEPRLVELPSPVFLIDYPASQAALARKKPGQPELAERFELYALGVELSNGFGELTCPREQRARFVAEQARRRAESEPVYPLDERFLAALEEGLPPSGGNALGFDRLLMLALGERSVDRVMAFPRAALRPPPN